MSSMSENEETTTDTFYGGILTWAGSAFCLAGLVSIFTLAPANVGERRKYKGIKHHGETTSLISNEHSQDGTYGAA